MKQNTNFYLVGIVLGLLMLLTSGCIGSKTAVESDQEQEAIVEDETDIERRRSGPIAAAAGEEVGWASTIDGEEAKRQPFAVTEGLLHGQIAGVTVFQRSDGTLSVSIRGPSSILGSNEPLFVIDGMPILNMEEGVFINPHDIAKIEVLKDADSKALYGARGANGVVLITTKLGPDN